MIILQNICFVLAYCNLWRKFSFFLYFRLNAANKVRVWRQSPRGGKTIAIWLRSLAMSP